MANKEIAAEPFGFSYSSDLRQVTEAVVAADQKVRAAQYEKRETDYAAKKWLIENNYGDFLRIDTRALMRSVYHRS